MPGARHVRVRGRWACVVAEHGEDWRRTSSGSWPGPEGTTGVRDRAWRDPVETDVFAGPQRLGEKVVGWAPQVLERATHLRQENIEGITMAPVIM